MNATPAGLLVILVLATSLPLTACARADQPSAGPTHPAWLTGRWHGAGWEVGASRGQFQRETTVTFGEDGTWTTSAGGSGTSWLAGERVVVEGVSAEGQKIRYTLKHRQGPDGPELWGTVVARAGRAEVSLKKLPGP